MNSSRQKTWKLLSLLFLVFFPLAFSTPCEALQSGSKLVDLCNEFNSLNTEIRDNTIDKAQAKVRLKDLITQIRDEYYASGGKNYAVKEWVFPLKGYSYIAIGGVNGNGYQEDGYDYFDGNRHTGHPSHDIFIHDKERKSIDDFTRKPVSVVSVTGGVVVAVEKNWKAPSSLRGGKYLWIYDPASNALVYYAHNSTVLVETGDVIRPGGTIAHVGRTGLNAYKKRSPTHLHVTYLSLVDGLPVPMDIYKDLLRSKLM